ncbi:hypothetical protein CXB51_003959 [Gossypium anomalum]|uniref:Uncharacterized protein n=1 Tax=Gossypium anomalum TaxID=47600 RepID=A0A8J6DAL2_9ROSI|nr:hypothetical protein CXB51_003959 [Gossypium anomalum]
MENEFLDKLEDNAAIRMWLEKIQFEKGDSLAEGYTLELWDFTRISVTQNEFQELRDKWSVDKNLFRAMAQFGTLHIVVSLSGIGLGAYCGGTFRSLSACRRAGGRKIIGCAQLLLAWFHGHFWKVNKVSYQVFSENYSRLKETTTPKRDDISEENWSRSFEISRKKTLSGEFFGLFPMRSSIGVGVLIRYLCLEFEEL